MGLSSVPSAYVTGREGARHGGHLEPQLWGAETGGSPESVRDAISNTLKAAEESTMHMCAPTHRMLLLAGPLQRHPCLPLALTTHPMPEVASSCCRLAGNPLWIFSLVPAFYGGLWLQPSVCTFCNITVWCPVLFVVYGIYL